MYVRIRLTPEQIRGIFATGSAACARSTTIEAQPDALAAKVEGLLASASGGKTGRTQEGAVVADTGGLVLDEQWAATFTSFGPRTTVDLRAVRAVRAWMILVGWFVLPNVPAAGAVALLFALVRRPPVLAPGLVFIVTMVVALFALRAWANRDADRWSRDAHAKLGRIEQQLASAVPTTPTYRT